jgi:hypothetical protein
MSGEMVFNICRPDFCISIGDVGIGGDKGMNLFQIFYLHIPSYHCISLLTLFSLEIHLICKSRTLSSGELKPVMDLQRILSMV